MNAMTKEQIAEALQQIATLLELKNEKIAMVFMGWRCGPWQFSWAQRWRL